MSHSLNIVFAGTPAFAIPSLGALIHSNHTVTGVYTQPDRRAGRGQKIVASPVKQWARVHDIPIFQPHTWLGGQAQATLQPLNCDLMVVVAYGLLLPKEILITPHLGCINVHASLLPRWRGAAPIQRAILAGDKKTGVSIMKMALGLDTGPILNQISTEIREQENAASLYARLAALGSQALLQTLADVLASRVVPHAQDDSQACYAAKLTKQEAGINWEQSALQIARQIRAFCMWPIAFTQLNDTLLKVHQAMPLPQRTTVKPGTIINVDKLGIDIATGEDLLRLQQLQFAGGKPLKVAEILKSRSHLFKPGTCFS